MGTERDAAGGVCGGETDVERTGGEADVVVAGVVDTDKSVITETNIQNHDFLQYKKIPSLWEQSVWFFRERGQSHR